MGIIIRDIQDEEMTIYNPDGTILVVTHNILCVNDICIQIREQGLEGYTFQAKGGIKQEITPKGHIKQGVSLMFNKQMLFLMGIKDKL